MRKRSGRPSRFAAVPNETIDDAANLDFMALGLLNVLLRHRDGWDITLERIGDTYGYGRDAMAKAMGLLQVARYVIKVRAMSVHGNLWSTEVYVYDTPATDDEVDALLAAVLGDSQVRRAEVIPPTASAREYAAKRQTKLKPVRGRQAPSVAVPRVQESPHSGATSGNSGEPQVGSDCRDSRQSGDPAVFKKTVGQKTMKKTSAPATPRRETSGSSSRASERPSAGANNEPTLSRETVQILADPSVQALVVQHLSPAQLAMTDRLITRELAALGRDGVERVSWRLVQGLAGESADSIRDPFGWLQTYMRRLGCARSCVCKRPDCERGVIWGDGTPCRDCQREAEDRMAAAATAGASAPEPESPPVPEQRPAAPVLPWQDCDGCDRTFRAPEPGLCRDCQTQSQYAAT